jgi:hypothetical protein
MLAHVNRTDVDLMSPSGPYTVSGCDAVVPRITSIVSGALRSDGTATSAIAAAAAAIIP